LEDKVLFFCFADDIKIIENLTISFTEIN